MTDAEKNRLIARLTVLEHVVLSMFRDIAIQNGKSADDVAAYAETIKQFIEAHAPRSDFEIYVNAEVDRLFQQIASDIRNLGNQGT